MHKKPGYILFTTFILLSMLSMTMLFFFSRGTLFRVLIRTVLQRAQGLRSGIGATDVAQSYLYITPEEKKENQNSKPLQEKPEKKEQPNVNKKLFSKTVVYSQFPKTYPLEEKIDGADGFIKLMFVSEAGKFNINAWYNFKDKKFYGQGTKDDRQKVATFVFEALAKVTGKKNLFTAFEELCKKRDCAFNDVLELLEHKDFKEVFGYHVYRPLPMKKEGVWTTGEKPTVYLTDLFTVTSMVEGLDPWMLSYSVQLLCGIQPSVMQTYLQDEEKRKELISKYKDSADWSKDWDTILQPVYGISYEQFPSEIKGILTLTFAAHIFSIVASMDVNGVYTTVQAILKQKMTQNNQLMYQTIKIYQR